MPDVTLLAPTSPELCAFGVRSLSAYLKCRGLSVRTVFLPGGLGLHRESGEVSYIYSRQVLDGVLELSAGSKLVGISFLSAFFDRAAQLAACLKNELGATVVMGGIHATLRPQECLELADYVCVGEGEFALSELALKLCEGCAEPIVKGVWNRRGGRGEVCEPVKFLDELPFFDFSCQEQYVLDISSRKLVPLDKHCLERQLSLLPHPDGSLKRAYWTLSDRGCPHADCSYCNVPSLTRLYRQSCKASYFRQRGLDHLMRELGQIKREFGFVEAVQILDDTFFVRRLKWIEEFAGRYKTEIGLPLYLQASPGTLDQPKLEALLDAGLVYVEMGVQTGSAKTRALYCRKEDNQRILEAAKLLGTYKGRLLPPDYHVIIDNPWEDESEALKTVELLSQFPRPFGLCLSSLTFFPGSELHAKALAEGKLKDHMTEVYRKPFFSPPKRSYSNMLLYLLTHPEVPSGLIKFLLKPEVSGFFRRLNPAWFYRLTYLCGEAWRLARKAARDLGRGDFRRISFFLRRLCGGDPLGSGRLR